jgi:AraC-like DNA-binding protein
MMSEGAIWQPQWQENDFDLPDMSAADPADERDEGRGIFEELRWREPGGCSVSSARHPEIEVSRWTAAHGEERCEVSITPRHCHIVSLSLAVSRVRWTTASGTLFEGLMPAGTMHISAPRQKLTAQFTPPFDFLHFHVDNRFLCEEGIIADETSALESSHLPLFRDALAEALGRSLLDPGDRGHPQYLASACKAIVMRALARQQDDRRCSALPKWRLRRVEQYLVANIAKPVSLHDMAAAAGLSRMHFAAQFRAATGFRPHEYLLLKRVEHAKIALAETGMPLVEVAFSAGFNAQAHFSTVFKRFTGKSPARWKNEYRALNGATVNRRLREIPRLAKASPGETREMELRAGVSL